MVKNSQSWSQLVKTSSNEFQQVSTSFNKFQPVSTNFNQFQPVLTIIFWPQYLEFLGFFLLIVSFISIILYKDGRKSDYLQKSS